jgi:hypothetical protein
MTRVRARPRQQVTAKNAVATGTGDRYRMSGQLNHDECDEAYK